MTLLLLKLLLVPSLVAAVTLASRRWGMRVGGILAALPLVAGPTLAFYAVEQGETFAATAARSAILGIVANTAFCVAYARSARHVSWQGSVVAGAIAFILTAAACYRLADAGGLIATPLALAALAIGRRMIGASPDAQAATATTTGDLPLRMVAAAALVIASTSLAALLGPRASGVISVFPLITLILAVFTHVQRGAESVAVLLRGLLKGLSGFVVFCLVLSTMLGALDVSLVTSFAAALAAQIVLQGLMLWRLSMCPIGDERRAGPGAA